MSKPPKYAYVLPILLGVVAAAAPANFPFADQFFPALGASTVVFGLVGGVCAGIWPGIGWRWGLWVIAPGFTLVSLGVITSGDWSGFLTDDLPFIATGFLGASLGAAGVAQLRSKTSTGDAEGPAS